jgi:UDP-N-acetylmuramyl pentapeptide phosphotransferase/UDP-N-acetylglucosamine-1-phosphate transferase
MLEHLIQTLQQFYLPTLLWGTIFFFVLYFLILNAWSNNQSWTTKTLHSKGKQRVHEGEIPRLGGVIIYLFLVIFSFFLSNLEFAKNLQINLLYLIPMMLVTLNEDLTHNVDFKVRFLALALSAAALIMYAVTSLPVVDHIIVISDLFHNPVFSFAFFTLCLIALANGCNFIDGMNGLLGFYILGALMCCMQLSFSVQDTFQAKPIVLYASLTILFLLVNYPWGRLFMGDAGAYLMALLIGVWVIDFFGTHESLSSWNAGLIFYYPIAEVIYSVIRKLWQNKSPFQPDREHLHLKIFDILNTSLNKPRLANNLTTVFLAIFWLGPPLILPWVYDSQPMIATALVILSFTYITLNRVIPPAHVYAKT